MIDFEKIELIAQRKWEVKVLGQTMTMDNYAVYGVPTLSPVVGIDPGRNFGLTLVAPTYAYTVAGQFPAETPQEWALMAHDLIGQLIKGWVKPGALAIVEGASFGDPYGQVGLAMVRAGFFIGLAHARLAVEIVAPQSIRKGAFGHGRRNAKHIWEKVNHNGADSLGAALYGVNRLYAQAGIAPGQLPLPGVEHVS
jgi:hypothetical protein